jgi:hypothetical protein
LILGLLVATDPLINIDIDPTPFTLNNYLYL